MEKKGQGSTGPVVLKVKSECYASCPCTAHLAATPEFKETVFIWVAMGPSGNLLLLKEGRIDLEDNCSFLIRINKQSRALNGEALCFKQKSWLNLTETGKCKAVT